MALVMAGCASLPPETTVATRFARALEGTFDNRAQWDQAPDRLRRPPAAGHPYDWIDLQFASFYAVDAPTLGHTVIYVEWRAGGPDGPISRQRIWTLRNEGPELARMDFYTFRDPAPYAGRGDDPAAFAALKAEDLIGYGADCGLFVTERREELLVATIHENTCTITSRSGRRMGIRASVILAGNSLTYSEAGILEDGSFAFLVPGGANYQFLRSP